MVVGLALVLVLVVAPYHHTPQFCPVVDSVAEPSYIKTAFLLGPKRQ